MSKDLTLIYWSDPKDPPEIIKGQIRVDQILDVTSGLYRNKKKGEDANDLNSFSIATSQRTLELESPTLEARNLWMGYFSTLLSHKRLIM